MSPQPHHLPFEHAFAMERALRTWYAAQGVPTIPCNEFSGRNGEHQQAPTTYVLNEHTGFVERMVLPDLIRLPNFLPVEVKCQGYAPMFRKAGVRTTGFLRRHFNHYRKFEQDTGRPVEIAFVHLVENEIRGGTLAEMEPARTRRVNVGESELWFWEYEALGKWPHALIDDVLELARYHGKKLGREGYSDTDHKAVMEYLASTAQPNYDRHEAEWNSAPVSRIRIPKAASVEPTADRQLSLLAGKL